MAMPMSARVSAGASFTPSPTMATFRPWACNWATFWSLAQLEQQMQAGQHYAIDLIGTEAAQQATGFIIADARNQQNLLVVHDLPSLPEAQQYQLWLIKDGHRTSGAVFSVSPAGYGWTEITAPLPLSDYASFGVTIEPAGGSPGPTGAKVLGTTF